MSAANDCTLDALVGRGFRCIVADPPWPMERRKGTLYAGATNTPPMKTVNLDYPTMTIADIAAMPVRGVAAKGCHLYLWTTQRFLRDAYTVLDAWGVQAGRGAGVEQAAQGCLWNMGMLCGVLHLRAARDAAGLAAAHRHCV